MLIQITATYNLVPGRFISKSRLIISRYFISYDVYVNWLFGHVKTSSDSTQYSPCTKFKQPTVQLKYPFNVHETINQKREKCFRQKSPSKHLSHFVPYVTFCPVRHIRFFDYIIVVTVAAKHYFRKQFGRFCRLTAKISQNI